MINLPDNLDKNSVTAKRKIKAVCVFGTRPEAIKMAPLVNRLKARPEFETMVLVTAQHREMLDIMLSSFNITPDIDLNIMGKNQTLTDVTTKVLVGAGEVFEKERPDIVLVHGDTSTTFSAALAAFYAGITLGHVEAGLRTYNKREPFPEEINRCLTTQLADLHFAPTINSKNNLLKENIPRKNIYVTGNTEIDSILDIVGREDNYVFSENLLNSLDYGVKTIVMTAHRRENLGKPMESCFKAIKRIVNDNKDIQLVYPVHLNPKVRETAGKIFGGAERIHLLEPLAVTDMYHLINKSYMVVTDSGGIQESAPALNKPCVVLRNVTERPEGVETGVLTLAGTEEENVYSSIDRLIHDAKHYGVMAGAKNPFGDGKASDRIISSILYHFNIIANRPLDFE